MAESEQAKGPGPGKPAQAPAAASPAPPRPTRHEADDKTRSRRATSGTRISRVDPLPLAEGEYPLPLASDPPPPWDDEEQELGAPESRPAGERPEPRGEPAPESEPPSSEGPAPTASATPGRIVGRCELFTEIARGGMATIHLGRWLGAGGFAKPVAVKALHPNYARDPVFVRMFMDEARVVAGIRHPNVMPTIDLVEEEGELFIVMEYVEGVTLAHLVRRAWETHERIPVAIVLRIMAGVLHGLHAAHEAKNSGGEPMCVIHRDVSPENIMVAVDGYPRLIDFGIATALDRYSKTRDGQIKGKLAYLAPEQVLGAKLSRRTDVFTASIVLWQALTGRKLFPAQNVVEAAHKVLNMSLLAPSAVSSRVPKGLDRIVMRGLERDPEKRWATAEAMAEAVEAAGRLATYAEVGSWVRHAARERLGRNARAVSAMARAPIQADSAQLSQPLSVHPAARAEIGEELAEKIDAFEGVSGDELKTDVTALDAAGPSPPPPEPRRWPRAAKPALYALGAVGLLGLGLALGMSLKGGAQPGSFGANGAAASGPAASASSSTSGPLGKGPGPEPGTVATDSARQSSAAPDAGAQVEEVRDAEASEPADASAKPWAPTPGGGRVPTAGGGPASAKPKPFIPPDI